MQTITDPKLHKLLELVEVDKHKLDRESLLFLLSHTEGRWFLMRLFDRTDLFGNTFNTDALVNAYSEGRRSIGIGILSDIKSLGMEGLKLKQEAESEYAKLIEEAVETKRKLIKAWEEEHG